VSEHLPAKLHHLLMRCVIETGHAPGLPELAALAGCTEGGAADALRNLAAVHGVVLVPNSLTVWSLHPFSMLPTAFWVESRRGGWWANCAWCSLGIAAILRQDVTITTRDGAEGEALTFRVAGGVPAWTGVIHFPERPARWWDNPICPCANILFFSSEARVSAWCARHGQPKGSVLHIGTGMKLADRWFGEYASVEWRRKTAQDGEMIFRELGLDHTFWKMPASFQ
jgi:Alkylmercury lyase